MVRVPRCFFAAVIGFGVWIAPASSFAEIPPARALSAEALEASLPREIRAETLPGGYTIAIPEPFTKPVTAVDPVYRSRCSRALYLYERDAGLQTMTRRVTLRFEPDDADSALRSARLIARLLRLHRERFGRETVFGRGNKTCDVWFIPTTPKTASEGGETRDANVYIFAANEIATPLELVRTVAHEWGHLTLPAARGYAEPESDAAGYLGERLYLKWLFEDNANLPKTARTDDGTTPENLALYHQRQVAPLMERWRVGGPNNAVLNDDRTEAMDYYIGAVLEYDRTFSSRVVANALYGIVGETARDFLVSMKEAVNAELAKGLSINVAAWVPLSTGTYNVAGSGGRGRLVFKGPRELGVAVAGAKRDTTFRVPSTGWYKAYSDSESLTGLTLKSGKGSGK